MIVRMRLTEQIRKEVEELMVIGEVELAAAKERLLHDQEWLGWCEEYLEAAEARVVEAKAWVRDSEERLSGWERVVAKAKGEEESDGTVQ